MESENKLFEDFGVFYTTDKKTANGLGFTKFEYTGEYSLNGEPKQKINKTVYCRNVDEFNRLINGWNTVDKVRWKFYV